VSEAPYSSFNTGFHVGDDPAAVLENRCRLANALGFKLDALTSMQQVHGVRVGVIDAELIGRGGRCYEDAISDTDAIITNQPDALLMVLVADCVAVALVDPVHKAVGEAHGGWRGTLGRIGTGTVAAMRSEYGTNPSDLLIGISPCIHSCCYPVGSEIAEKFLREFPDVPGLVDGNRLDVGKAMVAQLIEAGVCPESIEVSEYCTSCRTDLFYSYRGEGGTTGRIALAAGFKGEH
jgi:YfiH family protein